MSTSRGPSGLAMGALFGEFPDQVAFGIPPLMGFSWFDDFAANDNSADDLHGEKRWTTAHVGTGAVFAEGTLSNEKHSFGLRRVQVAVNGDRGVLIQNANLEEFENGPPEGALFCCKVRHDTSTTGATLWVGFAEDGDIPGSGVSTDFVGVRCEDGGNWFGVTRNNTLESTVDLGVGPSTAQTDYRILGFLVTSTGFRFFTATAASRKDPPFLTWFDELTTNLPNEDLTPVIGIQSNAAGTKGIVIDFFSIGGRAARS